MIASTTNVIINSISVKPRMRGPLMRDDENKLRLVIRYPLTALDPGQTLGNYCGPLNGTPRNRRAGDAAERRICRRRRSARIREARAAQGLRQNEGQSPRLRDEGRARAIGLRSCRVGDG